MMPRPCPASRLTRRSLLGAQAGPHSGWLGAGLSWSALLSPSVAVYWLFGPKRSPPAALVCLGLGSASPPASALTRVQPGQPRVSRGLETVAAAVTSLRELEQPKPRPGKGRQLCLRPCQLLTVVSS